MLKGRVWGTSSFDALDAHVYTLPCAAAFLRGNADEQLAASWPPSLFVTTGLTTAFL